MREAMDFDPSPAVNQGDMVEYLKKHHVLLPPGIVIEWCHPDTYVKVHPSQGGVYFYL